MKEWNVFQYNNILFGKQDWVKKEYQTEVGSLYTSYWRTDLSALVVSFILHRFHYTYTFTSSQSANTTLLSLIGTTI